MGPTPREENFHAGLGQNNPNVLKSKDLTIASMEWIIIFVPDFVYMIIFGIIVEKS